MSSAAFLFKQKPKQNLNIKVPQLFIYDTAQKYDKFNTTEWH